MARVMLIRGLTAAFTSDKRFRNSTSVDIEITDNKISRIGTELDGNFNEIIDGTTCIAIPGLVNTHHHFYQTLTRAIPRMQNAPLFPWLIDHYRVWECLTSESIFWSSLTAMGELLLTGCTTSSDHHYLFPNTCENNLIDQQISAARKIGIRFLATRGSMSVSKSSGGLPPDCVVQEEKTILDDCRRLIETCHDPSPDSMQRIALAPCSPFSVSEDLMRKSALLARKHNVQLHTHLAETLDEENYCLKQFHCRPVELMRRLDWLGSDVWFAHCVHLNQDEIKLFGATGTGTAHCPSSNMRLGSGIAPIRELLAEGAPIGIAVDGSASNDSSDMLGEVRQALLLQRVLKGADALTVEEALTLGSKGGADMLGFKHTGSLEVGYLADIALFSLNSLDFVGVHDPIGGLLLTGDSHRAKHVFVNGIQRVKDGKLTGVSENDIIDNAGRIARELLKSAIEKSGVDFLTSAR